MILRLMTVPGPPFSRSPPPLPTSESTKLSWMLLPTISGEEPESSEKIPPPAPWEVPLPPAFGGVLTLRAISFPAMTGWPYATKIPPPSQYVRFPDRTLPTMTLLVTEASPKMYIPPPVTESVTTPTSPVPPVMVNPSMEKFRLGRDVPPEAKITALLPKPVALIVVTPAPTLITAEVALAATMRLLA